MSARGARSLHDLRLLAETSAVTVVTWLVLGWSLIGDVFHHADGPLLVDPLTKSTLHSGVDWTDHLYRFGVLGGSKMHEFAGTMPIVQLCGLVGLPTTVAVNVVTLFLQVTFGFFGLKIVEAGHDRATRPPRSVPLRICVIWACAFAPILGWRLSVGHENLIVGLLPFVATVTLLWCARAKTLSAVSLAVATFAVVNGVSGLGAQTVIYGAVFGLPIVLAIVFDAPRGSRWGRDQWTVVAALLAGVLIALPRLWPMLLHATSGDATRGIDESVTYSYGAPVIGDWIESLVWTRELAARAGSEITLHERNYPIGPLVLMLPLLWHRTRNRWLGWSLLVSLALAIAFALDIRPISTGLLAVIEPLRAFRVPARATLPVGVVLAPLLLGAALAWPLPATEWKHARGLTWMAVVVGLGAIAGRDALGPAFAEALAWTGCAGLLVLVLLRRGRREPVIAIATLVAALGVTAFAARFPRDVARDPIEDGPAEVRAAVLAQAPELAMPLARVQIIDAPPPYRMSLAFASGLSSLDGVWYPPRRYLALLSHLMGHVVPPTAAVFTLSGTQGFPVLQQMYNVTHVVSLQQHSVARLPPTPGPAWFPRTIELVDARRAFAVAMGAYGARLRDALMGTAWLLRQEAPDVPLVGCAAARVSSVDVDARGQTATIEVSSVVIDSAADATEPYTCVLVVATNYVSSLAATAFDASGRATPAIVFPIDVALTAIAVPIGTRSITLEPIVRIALWTRIAFAIGFLLFAGALAMRVRRAR